MPVAARPKGAALGARGLVPDQPGHSAASMARVSSVDASSTTTISLSAHVWSRALRNAWRSQSLRLRVGTMMETLSLKMSRCRAGHEAVGEIIFKATYAIERGDPASPGADLSAGWHGRGGSATLRQPNWWMSFCAFFTLFQRICPRFDTVARSDPSMRFAGRWRRMAMTSTFSRPMLMVRPIATFRCFSRSTSRG